MHKRQFVSLPPPARIASPAMRAKVAALIAEIGVVRAAGLLGLNRSTMIALAAGVDVRPGSIALASARFAELAAAPRVTA